MANAAVPLTASEQWRGLADVLAVGFYLAGVVPLLGLALMDIGLIGRRWNEDAKLKVHALFVAGFLVVAHIAMVFGMLDPTVLGWVPVDAPMHHSGH